MKPKDCMIGDILMAHLDDEEKDFPVAIIGLDENGTLVDGDCEFSWRPLNKEDDDIQYADALFPIPLTPEILEKNGFNHHGCVSKNKQYQVAIQHWSKDNLALNKVGKHGNPAFIPDLIYVHELQHALRLCGLDELADNFKI